MSKIEHITVEVSKTSDVVPEKERRILSSLSGGLAESFDLKTFEEIEAFEKWRKNLGFEKIDIFEKSDYDKKIDQTPISNGHWDGERGNSTWYPDEETLLNEKLKERRVDGVEYKDGYPDFSPVSDFETILSEKDFWRTDKEHRDILCEKLKEKINSDPEFAKKFTPDEIEQINAGKIPARFAVHHGTEPGQLQLVDRTIHEKCSHVGGRNIWGGGTEKRIGGKQ